MTDPFRDAIEKQITLDRYAKGRIFENHTMGDFVRAVLAIQDAGEARAFYDSYIVWLDARPDRLTTVEGVARSNIGWCYGEGMTPEHIAMWKQATGAAHPVLPL